MALHPDALNRHDQPLIPWESLDQIAPKELEKYAAVLTPDKYPRPWALWDRGNGHIDLLDSQDRVFAHVYCWDEEDFHYVDVFMQKYGQSP
jgi:hypothetical protein